MHAGIAESSETTKPPRLMHKCFTLFFRFLPALRHPLLRGTYSPTSSPFSWRTTRAHYLFYFLASCEQTVWNSWIIFGGSWGSVGALVERKIIERLMVQRLNGYVEGITRTERNPSEYRISRRIFVPSSMSKQMPVIRWDFFVSLHLPRRRGMIISVRKFPLSAIMFHKHD